MRHLLPGLAVAPVFSRGREPEYNLGISVTPDRRTNIGVLNGEDKPSRVEAKVFDGSGTLVQTIGFELKAEAWQQKSISAPVEDGYVQWNPDLFHQSPDLQVRSSRGPIK